MLSPFLPLPPLSLLSLSPSHSVNVKGLGPGTDIQPLAVQIITSCELIQPGRLPEVEQLLAYLQKRKANNSHTEFDGKSSY